MAVTLTVSELAVALGVAASVEVPDTDPQQYTVTVPHDQEVVLTRLLAVAKGLIELEYPLAPQEVQNEGVIRLCGWLYDTDPSDVRHSPGILRNSGVGTLMAPFHKRRLVAAQGEDAPATKPFTGWDIADLAPDVVSRLLPTFAIDRTSPLTLQLIESGLSWKRLLTLFEEELYEELSAGANVGDVIVVKGVDAANSQLMLDTAPQGRTRRGGWRYGDLNTTVQVRLLDADGKLPVAGLPDGVPLFSLYADGGTLNWNDRIYAPRAVVTHGTDNAWYICILATTGKQKAETEPGVGTSWQTYWARMDAGSVAALAAVAGRIPAQAIPALTQATRGKLLAQASGSEVWSLVDAPPSTPADGTITLAKLAAAVLARIAPALTGQGGKFLAVKSDASAVELVDKPSGTGTAVAPHVPASGDAEVAGLTIGTTDYEIVDLAGRKVSNLADGLAKAAQQSVSVVVDRLEAIEGVKSTYGSWAAQSDATKAAVAFARGRTWSNAPANPSFNVPNSTWRADWSGEFSLDNLDKTAPIFFRVPHGTDPMTFRMTIGQTSNANGPYPGTAGILVKIIDNQDGYDFYGLTNSSRNAAYLNSEFGEGATAKMQTRPVTHSYEVPLSALADDILARMAPALTGQGGKFLAVKSDASAVELVDKPGGGGGAAVTIVENISRFSATYAYVTGTAYTALEKAITDGTYRFLLLADKTGENFSAMWPTAGFFGSKPTRQCLGYGATLAGGTGVRMGEDRTPRMALIIQGSGHSFPSTPNGLILKGLP